ncbi:hypothetical protein ACFUN8_34595 [Streptomyces sp. NPDC057307]|uniref:hypothetical protein n=1 Tax=Streptomyces sp. NPDC057307 TaxID=3346096 RepID=UPI00363CBF5C
MPLIVAAVTGAGTAVGTGAVQVVSDLVRERLGDSEQGRAALTGLDQAPDDSTAADRLQTALRDALDADPAFARRLIALLEAPPLPTTPPAPAGSVVIGDSNRLRGSNISLGPLSISTTRGGPGTMVTLVVVVVGIVALAVYGGVRAINGDDSPRQRSSVAPQQDTAGAQEVPAPPDGAAASPAEGQLRTVLEDRDVVESVLPGLDAAPGGWTQNADPTVFDASEQGCPDDMPDVLFCGEAEYEDPSTDNVAHFQVLTFSSVKSGESAYQTWREEDPPSLALPALGEESHATSRERDGAKQVMSVVRTGSVVAGVTYEISAVDWTDVYGADHLELLTRMLTSRVQQALDGQAPTARAEL